MKKFLISLVSVFILSLPAYAINIDTTDNLVIDDDLLDDSYFASANAVIKGNVLGDLYIFGSTITINGNIYEDLVVIGGKVQINGNVSGDLRVIGGQVSIFGNVGDDLVIAGGQVDISKDSVIDGSILSGAGILSVDGQVKGELRGAFGMLFISGKIFDNVSVTIEDSINIDDDAEIYGDLNYTGLIEANIPDNTVKGDVNFNKFERDSIMEDINQEISNYSAVIAKENKIRKILKIFQINFSKKNKNCCIEGRDISTKILPNSDLKFFFKCNLNIAAKRRYKELKKSNTKIKLKDVKKSLKIRNILDTKRKNSPLLKHRDSVEIDTGKLNKQAMLAKMSKYVEKILNIKYGI